MSKRKAQSGKWKIEAFSLVSCVLCLVSKCIAEEITILYTGNTRAMLYHCDCPREPDGGVARRAALVRELRTKYPGALLLDSGNFFAGGPYDNYSQNTQLDKERSLINLQAMALMRYDALALGEAEFNFGWDFFKENTAVFGPAILSCNFTQGKVLPDMIKEAAGVKIGIIGLTSPLARQKAAGVEFGDAKPALTARVAGLKKRGADIVVLLANLDEEEALGLVDEVRGIDILITGRAPRNVETARKAAAGTIILQPAWQGRKLGRLTLVLKDRKIIDYQTEYLRLSDKIVEDGEALKILPRCFSDEDCRKEGFSGFCADPGKIGAQCQFRKANKVTLSVISSRACVSCNPLPVTEYLKSRFPGLAVTYDYYPDSRQAVKAAQDLKLEALPAYLLGSEIENEAAFPGLKQNLVKAGHFYALRPSFAGVAYFFRRPKLKGRVDLFISLYNKESAGLLEAIKDLNPAVHFLVVERQPDSFEAAGGNLEVEEDKRALCIGGHFPSRFWDYIICRAKSSNSSWWEKCAIGLDAAKVSACAQGPEANRLLRENSALNKELSVMFGPTYLVDNQEIFSSRGEVTKEELKKMLAR